MHTATSAALSRRSHARSGLPKGCLQAALAWLDMPVHAALRCPFAHLPSGEKHKPLVLVVRLRKEWRGAVCCTGCTAAAALPGADLRPELQGLQSQSQPQADETKYHDAQAGMSACSDVACTGMPRLGWPNKDETDGSCRALSSADNNSMSNSSPGCHRPAVPNSVYSQHGEGELMVGLRLRTLQQQDYTIMLPRKPTAQHACPWNQKQAG